VNIALIDYGAGNVASVERALERLGAASRRIMQPADLASAGAIILPGVGHYAAIIRALDSQNLRSPLLEAIRRGVPFLGICLGLQALYACSEEAPALAGLGLLAGGVSSLPQTTKLPHMGWNRLRIVKPTPLLEGLGESDYFYFAHTFAALQSAENAVALSDYGTTFTAALERGNVFATQFHPEKSGTAGARLLQNFLRLAARRNLA
jgi:imidazole glycerol phosphate synthase glutamine amidotransferase subunit